MKKSRQGKDKNQRWESRYEERHERELLRDKRVKTIRQQGGICSVRLVEFSKIKEVAFINHLSVECHADKSAGETQVAAADFC